MSLAARPPSALERIDEIAGALGSRAPSIFLDYDGTLTPIAERPEDAVLSGPMRERLRALARRATVSVVSGRDLDQVRRLVALDTVVYAGSHGFDIAGPGGLRLEHPDGAALLPEVDRAEEDLRRSAGDMPGVLVERKRFSVAVHFRLAARELVAAVEAAVERVAARHPRLARLRGKEVVELRPDVAWDKGTAVLWLLERLGRSGLGSGSASLPTYPIYLGDDTTDEDAFRALDGRGIGIAVLDAPRETLARYSLRDPEGVGRFLEALAARIGG
jgi:trehalose-phosphatase